MDDAAVLPKPLPLRTLLPYWSDSCRCPLMAMLLELVSLDDGTL